MAFKAVDRRRMFHGIIAVKRDSAVSVVQVFHGHALYHPRAVRVENQHHVAGMLDIPVIPVYQHDIPRVERRLHGIGVRADFPPPEGYDDSARRADCDKPETSS